MIVRSAGIHDVAVEITRNCPQCFGDLHLTSFHVGSISLQPSQPALKTLRKLQNRTIRVDSGRRLAYPLGLLWGLGARQNRSAVSTHPPQPVRSQAVHQGDVGGASCAAVPQLVWISANTVPWNGAPMESLPRSSWLVQCKFGMYVSGPITKPLSNLQGCLSCRHRVQNWPCLFAFS